MSDRSGPFKRDTITSQNGPRGYPDEYRTYRKMLDRCYRPTEAKYMCYGGRGVTVCDRWLYGEDGQGAFDCFLSDMGPKPGRELSLDRIDSDGQYHPFNCRWATRELQMKNRRKKYKRPIPKNTLFYPAC